MDKLESSLAGEAMGEQAALRSIRIELLGQFAPLLAGTTLLFTLATGCILFGHVSGEYLAGWSLLVTGFCWLSAHRLGSRASSLSHHTSPYRLSVETGLLAGTTALGWIALPATVWHSQPADTRILLSVAVYAMMGAALSITAVPLAASLWATICAAGLILAVRLEDGAAAIPLTLMTLLHLGLLLAIIRRAETLLARRASREMRNRLDVDIAHRLMREYEAQGTTSLWQTDAGHILTYATPGFATLLGRTMSELIGAPLSGLIGANGALGPVMLARTAFSGIDVELHGAGRRRSVSVSGTPVMDNMGRFIGFRGSCSDITEARSSERRLRQLASLDMLTELPNRMRMRELLGEALLSARASGRPCGLLLLDLDGFKPVNDTFGHPKGDILLKMVAERLVAHIEERGVVGRVGGDEFAVILHDTQNHRGVPELTARLIARISEPYMLDGVSVRIGLSIGSALGPIDGDTVDELVKKADLALYKAKAAGRGVYRAFERSMQTGADDRLKLEHDLRQALPLGQFRLHYQPLIQSRTGEVVGFEALLRWQHPIRGFVSPGEFVPLAEEIGLIHDLGEWVARTAIRDCARWPALISVAVNISPIQLLSSALPAIISEALSEAGLPANRLELEVTESVFLRDSDGTLDILRQLRSLGVRIALDDFGTGYSSLGYLNRTIFHKLKIDGSFVRDAATRPETVSIIQAIITLANCFQMTITAEGVETQDDHVRMADLGCHQMQGYLFGRPMPFEQAAELVDGGQSEAFRLARTR